MSRARYEIDPKVAVIKTRDAVVSAGRYSGRNLSALGTRVGRQAVVIGAEGARRGGGAWTVLRYGPPPSRRRRRSILIGAILLAGAAGAATALAVQRGLTAWQLSDPDAKVTGRAHVAPDLNSVAPTPEANDLNTGARTSP
ncbi:hypothetical protein OHA21_50985 [Actinoplanes sp. NBC_00393]|uniref:hypothetical protein n=1 Tax=Actinoplanes sp. NBC_00393 TaxID=2975953 RepID=UPI002E22E747